MVISKWKALKKKKKGSVHSYDKKEFTMRFRKRNFKIFWKIEINFGAVTNKIGGGDPGGRL